MSDIGINQILTQMRAMAAVADGGIAPMAAENVTKPDFGKLLAESINNVSTTQQQVNGLEKSFLAGSPNVDLSQVMVELQKASLSFEAMTQVRNKLVSAYQEIMNMQV